MWRAQLIPNAHSPRRSKHVDGLREDVIVNDARVNAKQAHEQDDVATAEENLKHFVVLEFALEIVFAQHQKQRRQKHDEPMAKVAEHHSEQKWKRYDGERRRIEFSIAGDAVGVYDILKATRELVEAMMSGRLLFGLHSIENRLNVASAHFL